MDPHECSPDSAVKMLGWIRTRGGVALWRSVNLSNPGASWSTPARTADVGGIPGDPYPRPTWEAADKPERVITDPAEIIVVVRKEVRRFRIALRRGGSGAFFGKLTDASSKKLRAALEKAGEGSSYTFDYETQEAIITMPDRTVPLAEWVSESPEGQRQFVEEYARKLVSS